MNLVRYLIDWIFKQENVPSLDDVKKVARTLADVYGYGGNIDVAVEEAMTQADSIRINKGRERNGDQPDFEL